MAKIHSSFLYQLWNALLRLFLHLSQDYRQRHLDNSQMSGPKDVVDLWEKLGQFIENVPVHEKKKAIEHSMLKQSLPPEKHQPKSSQPLHIDPKHHDNPSEHILKNVHVQKHPHVKDQMYKNAMEHINTAYGLAQEGDQKGAKIHIQLAQEAVHTASRFMDQDEYQKFEEKILGRIKHFIC